ncbi:hypothetical protein RUND412_008786 [Rhizina undulata]
MRDSTDSPDDIEKTPMLPSSSSSFAPIPTYEQATSSNPSASRSAADGRGNYRPPMVESARSSIDSHFLEEFADRQSLEREMVQLEVDDSESASNERLGDRIKKRLVEITGSLGRGWGWKWRWRLRRRETTGEAMTGRYIWRWRYRWRNPFARIRIPELPCAGSSLPLYRMAVVLILAVSIFFALMASDLFTLSSPGTGGLLGPFNPDDVRDFTRMSLDREKIRHFVQYLSSFDHIAGTQGDFVLSNWVEGQFRSFGLDGVDREEYNVFLNYPKPGGRKVAIIDPPWEAVLEEPAVDGKHENSLVFHGLSKTGSAEGVLLYANYGTREDFDQLASIGINVTDAIVLMRNGGPLDAGMKVRVAEERGAVGAILYTDIKTEGWDWPGDAVQRDTVGLANWRPGDVLTPGYASTKDAERVKKEDNEGLVGIPSLPLSWNDARHLLQSLQNHGSKVPESWIGIVPQLSEWWTGSADSPRVRVENDQVEEDQQPIWNVMGYIKGTEDHKKRVIIGAHRDAWCFGASDPNSGTAVMLEVARVFGLLAKLEWRPIRSIIFASWDAAEYNLIGSTEWVEENINDLRLQGTAYINLDAAITGTKFTATSSPLLQTALFNVLSRLTDPFTNETLISLWGDRPLSGPTSDKKDTLPFQTHAGVSSIDISFAGKGVPHGSCFDNFVWQESLGDKDWSYHLTLAQVLSALILELADRRNLPINMTTYSTALAGYVEDLEMWIEGKGGEGKVDLKKLKNAVGVCKGNMEKFESIHEDFMDEEKAGVLGEFDNYQRIRRNSRNARMINFEEHLLDFEDGGGLPGREWFKHVVYSPTKWGEPGYFPGIRDAVEDGDWKRAGEQVERVAKIIEKASWKLLN